MGYSTLSSGFDLSGGLTLGLKNITQIRGNKQIQAGTIYNAQFATVAAISLSKLENIVLLADGGQVFTANQPMGGFRLTNLDVPTSADDAANKSYVDSVAVGLRDFKNSVRVTTTGSVANLSSISVSGGIFDGRTLIEGDRILVKDGASADGIEAVSYARNGIYVVGPVSVGTAALVRSDDAGSSMEVTSGMYVYVSDGILNQRTMWVLSTADPIVLNTTALSFVQFSGAGQIVAGDGLVKTGSTIDVVAGAGSAIMVNPDSVQVVVDDSTLAILGNNIVVKAGGIAESQLASSIAGAGLGGGAGTPLFVKLGYGLEVTLDAIKIKLDGATLALSPAGVRSAMLPDGYVIVGNAGSVPTARQRVIREMPVGNIDGVNTVFALAGSPVNGSERVYLDGFLQEQGAGNEYTISGNIITYSFPPEAGSKLVVSYIG